MRSLGGNCYYSGKMEVERSSVKINSGEESELGANLEEDKPVHALRLETGEIQIQIQIQIKYNRR